MWHYRNPVAIRFGVDCFDQLGEAIGERAYALVTYDEPLFADLGRRLAEVAHEPVIIIDNIQPNPDFIHLRASGRRLAEAAERVELVVAVGGGSVIDAAKVLAFGPTGFEPVQRHLEQPGAGEIAPALPLIAVPTTAGTGSEVTSWATVWDTEASKKYSLARDDLYPTHAFIDPALMAGMPRGLTIGTGLDALSHSLESIWNVNANPVSTRFAITASRDILAHLGPLAENLDDLPRREHLARAAMMAGLAFSNTRTALAHSLSYPVTLHHGIAHGLACSFTLPAVMRSVIGTHRDCDNALREIFGDDLAAAPARLEALLETLGVSTRFADYGVSEEQWQRWVVDAIGGERGRNFIGARERVEQEFLQA